MKNALCNKRILTLALKGIRVEIEHHQNTIRKGQRILEAMANHEPVKTKLTRSEVEDVMREASAKVNELLDEEHDIDFELALLG